MPRSPPRPLFTDRRLQPLPDGGSGSRWGQVGGGAVAPRPLPPAGPAGVHPLGPTDRSRPFSSVGLLSVGVRSLPTTHTAVPARHHTARRTRLSDNRRSEPLGSLPPPPPLPPSASSQHKSELLLSEFGLGFTILYVGSSHCGSAVTSMHEDAGSIPGLSVR